MKIFVYDTETTGFINKKESDLNLQPKIVQFAGIIGEIKKGITEETGIDNREFKEEKRINIMINPGIPIPFGASQVHHIYDIDIKDSPYIEDVIDEIMTYINDPDMTIGHNIEYDQDMIKLELKRLEKEFKYAPKQVICTMKTTVDFCALQGNGARFKYPKLGELHKKLFGEYFIGAHDALTDVEATLRCFVELVKKGVIKIEEKKEEVMSLF
ncbi:MAG: 3'-5' exonuclease [Candidatus Gracilibacteria bacterium]|nr:3'-5' exonuclease [Candidatus Gracilibacteria bacterium]